MGSGVELAARGVRKRLFAGVSGQSNLRPLRRSPGSRQGRPRRDSIWRGRSVPPGKRFAHEQSRWEQPVGRPVRRLPGTAGHLAGVSSSRERSRRPRAFSRERRLALLVQSSSPVDVGRRSARFCLKAVVASPWRRSPPALLLLVQTRQRASLIRGARRLEISHLRRFRRALLRR